MVGWKAGDKLCNFHADPNSEFFETFILRFELEFIQISILASSWFIICKVKFAFKDYSVAKVSGSLAIAGLASDRNHHRIKNSN